VTGPYNLHKLKIAPIGFVLALFMGFPDLDPTFSLTGVVMTRALAA
jgi:hypothetical protein